MDMVSEPISPGFVPGSREDVGVSHPERDAEKTALLAWLNEQREHALGILDGLDEAALRRPVLPSGWTCLGMVRHLAGLERFWFRAVVAGERAVIDGLAEEPDEWQVAPGVPVGTVFDLYRREGELANAIIVATPLDAAPAWWPEGLFGDWRLHNLREIVLHVMTETACHAGHLDAARELIDGRQWLVLTE
ncbi:MAG: DinB family protein [Thermomicrobiales bacterium]